MGHGLISMTRSDHGCKVSHYARFLIAGQKLQQYCKTLVHAIYCTFAGNSLILDTLPSHQSLSTPLTDHVSHAHLILAGDERCDLVQRPPLFRLDLR